MATGDFPLKSSPPPALKTTDSSGTTESSAPRIKGCSSENNNTVLQTSESASAKPNTTVALSPGSPQRLIVPVETTFVSTPSEKGVQQQALTAPSLSPSSLLRTRRRRDRTVTANRIPTQQEIPTKSSLAISTTEDPTTVSAPTSSIQEAVDYSPNSNTNMGSPPSAVSNPHHKKDETAIQERGYSSSSPIPNTKHDSTVESTTATLESSDVTRPDPISSLSSREVSMSEAGHQMQIDDDSDRDSDSHDASHDDGGNSDDDCDDLDLIATHAEEKYVLRRLMQDIEAAEDVSRQTQLHPSLLTTAVTNPIVVSPINSNRSDSTCFESRSSNATWSWKTAPAPGPHRVTTWGKRRPPPGGNTKLDSRIQEIIEVRRSVKQSLPKWIPDDSGRYPNEDDDCSSLLFTRQQFFKHVVLEAEKLTLDLDSEHQTWKATLSDDHPQEPDSYLVEAEGTKKAMGILRNATQTFVRQTIERINLERLVSDGASQVVDVKCSIDLDIIDDPIHEVFGAHFSNVKDVKTEGVYIKSIQPRGTLAKTLGGLEAFKMGCALLAVNKNKVSDLSEVEAIVMQAKSRHPGALSSVKIELSLCLSKYADFSKTCNLSKLKISRKDGLQYDEEDYETLKLNRYIEWTQKRLNQPTKKVKKRVKRKEKEKDEGEESSSSTDESASPRSLNLAKKRRKRARIMNQKSVKRRKQIPKVGTVDGSQSSSESEIDTDFTVIDEDSEEEEIQKPNKAKTTGAGNKGIKSKAAAQGYAIFRIFEEKVKPLVLLDYKDTKINIKSICSSMWKKHKEIFGEDEYCGDNCNCLMWLPDMAEDVIKDHLNKQKKKNDLRTKARFHPYVETEAELEDRTCGICKNFVPKFVHLLNEKYPTETETQLVDRLVGMWESHRRNRLYGMKCRLNCGCQEEWDQIFGKGDKTTARKFLTMMKRSSLLSQNNIGSSDNKEGPSRPVVPRKKRDHVPSNETQDNGNNMKKRKPKLSGLITSMSSRINIFQCAVTSSSALGGYFRTRRNRCEVFSIYSDGQLAKDPRIKNGTIVFSIKYGGRRIPISSDIELKKFYEIARSRNNRRIFISFENKDVVSNGQYDRLNNICWNDIGQWKGTHNLDEGDGWAGGALNAPKPKPLKKIQMQNQNVQNTRPLQDNMQSPNSHQNVHNDGENRENKNVEESIHDPKIHEEWITIIKTEKPGQKISKPKNILIKKSSFLPEETENDKGLNKLLPFRIKKSKRERTHSKKVKISISNNEEVFFRKNEASNMFQVLMKNKDKTHQIFHQTSPEETLIDAFRNETCIDVIDALEAQEFLGALSEGVFDLEALLQNEYTLIGNEMKIMPESDGKNDLSAKYRILSIYINCLHLIEKTMSLKKWCALQIEIKCIDLQPNHCIADAVGGNVAVKLKDGNMKEDFGSLPIKKIAQHIRYGNLHDDEKLEYTPHNNKNFPFEKREFIIDLKKSSLHDSVATGRTLGFFNLELNDVEAKCSPDGKPSEFTRPLLNNNMQEISSGYVTINASKRIADKEYIMVKKHEIMRKMKLQLEYIERFNQDPKTPLGARLTANISGVGGKSILHAAIVLLDDKDLVEKMLRLGANPRRSLQTEIGTPLSLAQRNFERAVEREKNVRRLRDKNLGRNVDIEPLVQRCNKARLIVQILQTHVVDVDATETSFATPQKSFTAISTAKPSSPATPKNISNTEKEDNELQASHKNIPKKSRPRPPFNDPALKLVGKLKKPPPYASLANSAYPPAKEYQQRPYSDNSVSTRPDSARLPQLEPRTWVSLDSQLTKCKHGETCKFFKRRSCHYWHDVIGPDACVQVPARSLVPESNELPKLLDAEFKRCTVGKDKVQWWTAAYIYRPISTVIYVQRILKSSGRIGANGLVWFSNKKDALYSLQCTVFFYKNNMGQQRGDNNVQKPQQYRQSKSKSGGGFHKHHRDPNHAHHNHNSHRYHYHYHEQRKQHQKHQNHYSPPSAGHNPNHNYDNHDWRNNQSYRY